MDLNRFQEIQITECLAQFGLEVCSVCRRNFQYEVDAQLEILTLPKLWKKAIPESIP